MSQSLVVQRKYEKGQDLMWSWPFSLSRFILVSLFAVLVHRFFCFLAFTDEYIVDKPLHAQMPSVIASASR